MSGAVSGARTSARGAPASWDDLDWSAPPERLRDHVGRLMATGTPWDRRFAWAHGPLQRACRAGRPEIVADLLASGADHVRPEVSGTRTDTPISIIVGADIDPIAKLAIFHALVAAGHDPVAAGTAVPPLHLAAMRGGVPMVDMLLDAGVPADVRADDGKNVCHLRLRTDVVARVVAAGADPDAVDGAGIPALAQQVTQHNDGHGSGGPTRLEAAAALTTHGAAMRLPMPAIMHGEEMKRIRLLAGHGEPRLAAMAACMAMRAGMRTPPWPSDPAVRTWVLEGASAAIHESWAMHLLAEMGAAS